MNEPQATIAAPMLDPPGATTDDIISYYAHSWVDYRSMWMNRRNRALHFGYWAPDTRGHRQSLVRMNEEVAADARLAPGMSVVDAGCGVGGSSMWLAEHYGVEVTGITLGSDQRARAERYAAERGLSGRTRFVVADFRETGLPTASADVVWTQESVCHLQDKRPFLREAARLLKPGGRLVQEEWFANDRPRTASDEQVLSTWLGGWAIPPLARLGDYREEVRVAGFEDVEGRDISCRVEPSLRRLHRLACAFFVPAWALHRLGARSLRQHRNVVSARHQWVAYQRGLWRVAIVSAMRSGHDRAPRHG